MSFETLLFPSLAGVTGGFDPPSPSAAAKSLPKREPVDGVEGLGKSSFAVPSLWKVLPSLKPSARPKRPLAGCGGAWGVGVASSRLRVSASLIPDVFDSNDDVLKEEGLLCPKPNPVLPCCAGVFAHEGREDPVTEPRVTVEPLGSVFRPGNAGFDCCCPSDANPVWPLLVLPKLEKPEPPPPWPNFANPDALLLAAEKGFAGVCEVEVVCEGVAHGEGLLPSPPTAPKPAPLAPPIIEGDPNAGAAGLSSTGVEEPKG
jgi:hypothetical protein